MKTYRRFNRILPLFSRQSLFTKCLSVLLAMAVVNLSLSCSYYTVKDVRVNREKVAQQIAEFNALDKYVILHSGSLSWHLRDMVLNDDEQRIEGRLEPVSKRHISIKPRDSKKVHRYVYNKTDPLNELHLYLKEYNTFQDAKDVSIPLDQIGRISVNNRNTGKTIGNVLLGTVGTAFTLLLVAAALKSSCPLVYVKNGDDYLFTGELYPGVITPNMQHDDFLKLPDITPDNGHYAIKVTNELKEIQYTDQLELIMVNHDANQQVLLDKYGNIQTFSAIRSPVIHSDNLITDIDYVSKKDGISYLFNGSKETQDNSRSIEFEFERAAGQNSGKLFLTAKNSEWLDYAFGKFNEQFGWYYNTFQKEQQKVDKQVIERWVKGQHIPLTVYLKKGEDWELVERINSVGPLAMRDIAIPLDLSDVNGKTVQIKLETGFMFWELDFIGMDYSENAPVEIQHADIQYAIDQNETDVSNVLMQADNRYLVQPNIGDEVTVHFKAPLNDGKFQKTTIYLKNRGYYNYIRDYNGVPDAERLKSFKVDNAFTKFSEELYFDFIHYSESKTAYHE